MKNLLMLLATVTLLGGSGCASTLATGYTHATIPYAGTIADGLVLCVAPKEPLLATVALADLPLSFALDTALLPITGVRAEAVRECAVVVADFVAWGGEFMELLRQRVEAQYGWQFDTAWPTQAECVGMQGAKLAESAGEA